MTESNDGSSSSSSSRPSRNGASLNMNTETEDSSSSSLDYTDARLTVLTENECMLLHATKEYAVSSLKYVQVLTDTLGPDRSKWNNHPMMARIKPHLREWWLENKWKPQDNAAIILKCSGEDVVSNMQTQMRLQTTVQLKKSDPELHKLKLRVRRCQNWFLERLCVGQAEASNLVTN